MSASTAISGYGALIQLGDDPATPTGWLSIAEVYSIAAAMAGTSIEVTHLDSPGAWKEFISGTKEATVTLGMNFLTSDASQVDVVGSFTEADPADANRAWRLLWPDYGAVSRTATVDTGTEVWTTATNHGWATGQRVRFTTSGTAPTTSPAGGLLNGGFAYVGVVAADEAKLYPTSADAIADTNAINFTTAGSGTHTLASGSWWEFVGQVTGHSAEMPVNDRMTAQVVIKVTNSITFEP